MKRVLIRFSRVFKDALKVHLTHLSTFSISINYHKRLKENLNDLRAWSSLRFFQINNPLQAREICESVKGISYVLKANTNKAEHEIINVQTDILEIRVNKINFYTLV